MFTIFLYMNNFILENLGIIGVIIALVIFYCQNKENIKSRNENTNSNIRLADEKHKENSLIQKKIYLENILPKQEELRSKIQMLRNCYGNNDKNLHLRWVVDSKLKFDKHQSEYIFHGHAPEDYKFYSGIYEEFKLALPKVKNLFPNSYTIYSNFIQTLDPILKHTCSDKPSFDDGKWVNKWQESLKLLDTFIESTYNSDSELKNVWKD